MEWDLEMYQRVISKRLLPVRYAEIQNTAPFFAAKIGIFMGKREKRLDFSMVKDYILQTRMQEVLGLTS